MGGGDLTPIVFMILGLLMIIFHKPLGRFGAENGRGLARVVPWLYAIPPASFLLRPRSSALFGLMVGMAIFLAATVSLFIRLA